MHSNMMTEDPAPSYPQPALASVSRPPPQSGQAALVGASSQSSLAPLIGTSTQCSLTLILKPSQPVKFPACHYPSVYPRGPEKGPGQEDPKVGRDPSLDAEHEQLTDLASSSADGVGGGSASLSPMPRLEREDSDNVKAEIQCDNEEGSPSLPELVPENIPLLRAVEGRCKALQARTEIVPQQAPCERTQWKQNFIQLEPPRFESGSELTYAAEQAQNSDSSTPESCVSPELTEVLKRKPVVVLKRLSSRCVLDTQQRGGRVHRNTNRSIVIPSDGYESLGLNGQKDIKKAGDLVSRKPEKISPLGDMLEMSQNSCAFSGCKRVLHHPHTADVVPTEMTYYHSGSAAGTDLDAKRPYRSGGLVDSAFVLDVPCRVFPNGQNTECVTFQENHAEEFPGGAPLALAKQKIVVQTETIQKLRKRLKNVVGSSSTTLRPCPTASAHTASSSHRALPAGPSANDPKVSLAVALSDANNSARSQCNNQTHCGELLSGEPWEDGWESRPQAIFDCNQDGHVALLEEDVERLHVGSSLPEYLEEGNLLVSGPETVLSQASSGSVHVPGVAQECTASDLDNKCDLENPPDYLMPGANAITSEPPSIHSHEHVLHPALTASSEYVAADSRLLGVPGGPTCHEAKERTWNDVNTECLDGVDASQDASGHAGTVAATSQVSERAQTVSQQQPTSLSLSTAACSSSVQKSILLKITKDTKKSRKSSCVYRITQGVESGAPSIVSPEVLPSHSALSSMQSETVLKKSQSISSVEKVEERGQKDSCLLAQEAYHMTSSQRPLGAQSPFRNSTTRADNTSICTQLDIAIPSSDIAVAPVAAEGSCVSGDAACIITCIEKTSPSFVLPHREEKMEVEIEVESDLEVMQNHYYSTASAHRQHQSRGEAFVSAYCQAPASACPEEMLPPAVLSVMPTWTDDRVAIQHSYPRPGDALSHQSHVVPAGIIFISPVTTQRQVVMPRPSPARRHGFFRSVSDGNEQDFRHAEYKDIDIAALDLFENGIPSIRYEPEAEEIEADEDNVVVDEEPHNTDEIFETDQTSDCPIMPAETVIDCDYLSEAEKIAEGLVLAEAGSVVEPGTETVHATEVCLETAVQDSQDMDEASSAVQVVECEVLVDETEELADADGNEAEGYDSDATLPYPRNDDRILDDNKVSTKEEKKGRAAVEGRAAARTPSARSSSLERALPYRDRKNYPKRSRQTLPISLAELPTTDRQRKKGQKVTKPRGAGTSRHPLFKKRNKDVVERKKRKNEEVMRTGTTRTMLMSSRSLRAGEREDGQPFTDRKKHDKKDTAGSSALGKSSRALNSVKERRTQKKEPNVQHKPPPLPVELIQKISEERPEPVSEQDFAMKESSRMPKERQKGSRGRRHHRGRGRGAANCRLRAASPVTLEPSHLLSEDSESDELPTILPPKRRRNQGNKASNWPRSGGKVRQVMQDPLIDPHGSSAERIMREFPRHNWLEHKILHRSATYALPNAGIGGGVTAAGGAGDGDTASHRSGSGRGGAGGRRSGGDSRSSAMLAACGKRVAAARGADGRAADAWHEVGTCLPDDKRPAQQEGVARAMHASSTIPEEPRQAKADLAELPKPPTPTLKVWDSREGAALPLPDADEDAKGQHVMGERVGSSSQMAGVARASPEDLSCHDLHDSGGSPDSQAGAVVQRTRLNGPPSFMARSRSSDALLRTAGGDHSAAKQVKRRRCSLADVCSAETVDVKDLTRDLEDWKKMKSEAPACSSASHKDWSRSGNEALTRGCVPLTAACRTRESLDISCDRNLAVLATQAADSRGRPEQGGPVTSQGSRDVESPSLRSAMDVASGRSPHDRTSGQASCAEDFDCKKEIQGSSVPKTECPRSLPAASDNTLPLDLCVKKSEMLGPNTRPRGNLPVQLVLPQVQPKAAPLGSEVTSSHDPEAPGDIIGTTKQTLKVLSDSIADVGPEVIVAGGELTHLLPYASGRQQPANNAAAPGITSTSGLAFPTELASLPRSTGDGPCQGSSPLETVPGLAPRAGEGGLEPWQLRDERDLASAVRGSGSAINREYVRHSLSLAVSSNATATNSGVGATSGRHNSEPVTFGADRPDVEPYSSKPDLAFPVNLTRISMGSLESGAGVHAVPLPQHVIGGSVCASESDLDLEFEKTLREFRELEMLAARKEQEREQVLAMRKRKAEMLVQMEIKRRRLTGNLDGLPSSSAGTASLAACPDGPGLVLDDRLLPEEAAGVLDDGQLSQVAQDPNKAGLRDPDDLGLSLGVGRLGSAGPDLLGAGPQFDREAGHRADSFPAQAKDKEPMTEQEKRSVVEMINQAVACRKLRPHDAPLHLCSTGVRSAHDASKSSNPFISVDAKPVASAVTSPYVRRDTPLEEPPIPRTRQLLVGSPKRAHSQQPFQPAGSLIVLAPPADSPSGAEIVSSVVSTTTPSPSRAHAPATCSASEVHRPPSHELHRGSSGPDPATHDQGLPTFPDSRPAFCPAKTSRHHRPASYEGEACLDVAVIDLTREPSTPASHSLAEGVRQADCKVVTVDLDVETVIQSELSAAVAKKGNGSCHGGGVPSGFSEGPVPQFHRLAPRPGQHVVHVPQAPDVHGMEVGFARYPTGPMVRRKGSRHQPAQDAPSAGQSLHMKQSALSPMSSQPQQEQPGLRADGEPMNLLGRMPLPSGVRHPPHSNTVGYMDFPHAGVPHVRSGLSRFPLTGVPSRHPVYVGHETLSARDGSHLVHGQQLATSVRMGHPAPGVQHLPHTSMAQKLDGHSTFPGRPTVPGQFLPPPKVDDDHTLVLRNPMEETPASRLPLPHAAVSKPDVNSGVLVLMHQHHHHHQQQQQHQHQHQHQHHHHLQREVVRTEAMPIRPEVQISSHHGHLTTVHQTQRPTHGQQQLQHPVLQQPTHLHSRGPELPHHLPASHLPAVPATAVGPAYPLPPPLPAAGRVPVTSAAAHHSLSPPGPPRPLVPAPGPPVAQLYKSPARLPSAEYLSARPEVPVPHGQAMGSGVLQPALPSNRMPDAEHSLRLAQAADPGLVRGAFHSPVQPYPFPPQMSPLHGQPRLPIVTQPQHPRHGFLQHHQQHLQQQHQQSVAAGRGGPSERGADYQQRSPQHPQQLPHPSPQQAAPAQQQQQQQKHAAQLQDHQQQQPQQQEQKRPPQMPAHAKPEGTCGLCGKPAMYLCSNCRQVWYCSHECQTAHWATHVTRCKPNT